MVQEMEPLVMHAPSDRVSGATPATLHGERELSVRILAEFLEMPGLTLTLPQAARLFSLESTRCERMLRSLVQNGSLATDGRVFMRADGLVRTLGRFSATLRHD